MYKDIYWKGDILVQVDDSYIKDLILEERQDLEWVDDINYEEKCWQEFKHKIEKECVKILRNQVELTYGNHIEGAYHSVKDEFYVLWADVANLFSLEDEVDPSEDEANEGMWNGSTIELNND